MLKNNLSEQFKKNVAILALGATVGATAYFAVRSAR